MEDRTMHRIVLTAFALACLLSPTAAQAETIRPQRISKSEIAGEIFLRPGAVEEGEGGNASTDVVTFTSADSAFQTGVYKSGPAHEEIKGPAGLPYTEFLYFISGSVTLTDTDGAVMVVNAGEAVTLPKGWTGLYDTQGYTKMYVTYKPDDMKK